ncbi:VOC family protein [Pseudoroseicyclus sp. CXY001]|uniref:VOC family protein n=1 Tax=Pseudoroseicyclus sp. CXY001 TaxID=3242492 RepID=UPI0035711D5B
MPTYSEASINLYSTDLPRALAFYQRFGFEETFRTPRHGAPVHVELRLEGFTIGIATVEVAREDHGLNPMGEGRWIEIILWTDDVDGAMAAAEAAGAPVISAAHEFLGGRLKAGWIADPDGNPVQFVQRLKVED